MSIIWDYQPTQEVLDHWQAVRDRISAGQPANPNEKPPRTIEEQADRQIAILERDLEEWREIKAKASLIREDEG